MIKHNHLFARKMCLALAVLISAGCSSRPAAPPPRVVIALDVSFSNLGSRDEAEFKNALNAKLGPIVDQVALSIPNDATLSQVAIGPKFDRTRDATIIQPGNIRPSEGTLKDVIEKWYVSWAKEQKPWKGNGTDLQGFLAYLPQAREAGLPNASFAVVLHSDGYDQPSEQVKTSGSPAVKQIPLLAVGLDSGGDDAGPEAKAAFEHFEDAAGSFGVAVESADLSSLQAKLKDALAKNRVDHK